MTGSKNIFGLFLLVAGLLLLLNKFEIVELKLINIIYGAIAVYGAYLFYKVFGTDKHGVIFFSSVIFLLGLFLGVKNIFDIRFENKALYFAFFSIPGISLLMLFINNPRSYIPLLTGIALLLFAFLPAFGIFNIPVNLIAVFGDIFSMMPILIIIGGIIYLLNIKKSNK